MVNVLSLPTVSGGHKMGTNDHFDPDVNCPQLTCDYCGELEPWHQMIEEGSFITEERAVEIRKSPSWIKVACTHCAHVFNKDD